MEAITSLINYDCIDFLWFVYKKFNKLPQPIRDSVEHIVTEHEVDYIQSLSRRDLYEEVRTFGLLPRVEDMSDYELISQAWEADLPSNKIQQNDLQQAITKSFTSIELLSLIDDWNQQSKQN